MKFGWETIFYLAGGASVLLALGWLGFYPDRSFGRRRMIGDHAGAREAAHVQWTQLLRCRATWALALGQMGYLYAFFFFMTWIPGYLALERKMSVVKTGIYGSLPFLAGLIATAAGGWLADHLLRKGVNRTVSRKGIIGVGLMVATIAVVAAAFASGTWAAVTLLTVCMGALRVATASMHALPIDLVPPTAVASLTSLQNFGGNVGGLLAPIVSGHIVDATGSFVGALVAAGGMAMLGAISYVFVLGRIEPLPMETAGAIGLHTISLSTE